MFSSLIIQRITFIFSPFGELNWIFTAITGLFHFSIVLLAEYFVMYSLLHHLFVDSIAWNLLPVELFHKLFRSPYYQILPVNKLESFETRQSFCKVVSVIR